MDPRSALGAGHLDAIAACVASDGFCGHHELMTYALAAS